MAKESKDKKSSTKSKLGAGAIGVGIGALIGVVAGVLTAPKSGKETREDIKQKSGELKDKAVESGKKVKDKFDKKVE